jgi:uncharacterized protein (TIGR03083 family)
MAMSDAMFDDERDEALAVLWLDGDVQDGALAERAIEAWAPPSGRPPVDLVDRVMAEAAQTRPAGPASIVPPVVGPIDAYRRTAGDFAALLASLVDDDWTRPVAAYGTVHGMVAHLVGIERICLGWLGAAAASPADTVSDHQGATRATIDELAAMPHASLVTTWQDLSAQVAAAAADVPATHPVLAHDIPTDRDGLMLLRSFELWAHHDDIAVAVGHARLDVDAGRLLTLSRGLAQALPFAFALRGETPPDGTVRLVLISTGGGTYDMPFGTATDATAATIVVDTLDACRLAQQRVSSDELDVVIEGDAALVRAVLARFGSFARD